MRALALACLLMTACNSWYRDGHRTVSTAVTMTQIAWEHARDVLRGRCTDGALDCGRRGIAEDKCDAVIQCKSALATLQISIDAVYTAARESYIALESAHARQGTVGRVAILTAHLMDVARRLWAHLQEENLWPTYLPLSSSPQ